jgi:hypothetical protein
MLRLLSVLFFLVLFSVNTYSGGRHEGFVENIEAGNADGAIFFNTTEDIITYECTNPSGYIVPSDYAVDKVLSILLSAKMADKKVYFDINGCIGSYPRVIRAGLK